MSAFETTSGHQWREVRIHRDGRCPEGFVWSVRMLYSVRHEIPTFTDHMLAAAEGLDRPYYTSWVEEYSDDYADYVVGLRPAGPDDITDVEARERARVESERDALRDLMAKYPDVVEATLATASVPDAPVVVPFPPDLDPSEYGSPQGEAS